MKSGFKKCLILVFAGLTGLLCLCGCAGKDKPVSDNMPEAGLTGAGDSREDAEDSIRDGVYTIELTFEGGSGKAVILSSATLVVAGETKTATVCWNSPNYDYMLVDGEKYFPVNTEGDSVFEIPVRALDEALPVIGDTVAMSKPREIEYTITFHSDTIKPAE